MQLGSWRTGVARRVLKTRIFWSQKIQIQGYESQKIAGVGLCTLVRAGFFWLLLVI